MGPKRLWFLATLRLLAKNVLLTERRKSAEVNQDSSSTAIPANTDSRRSAGGLNVPAVKTGCEERFSCRIRAGNLVLSQDRICEASRKPLFVGSNPIHRVLQSHSHPFGHYQQEPRNRVHLAVCRREQKVAVTLRRDESPTGWRTIRFVLIEETVRRRPSYDQPCFHRRTVRSGYISTERDGYFANREVPLKRAGRRKPGLTVTTRGI